MNSQVIDEYLGVDALRRVFETSNTVDISIFVNNPFLLGGVCVEDSLNVVPGVPEINIRHPLNSTILPDKREPCAYDVVSNAKYPEPIDLETHKCWDKRGQFYVAQIYSMAKKVPVYILTYHGMGNMVHIRATPDGKLEGAYYGPYDWPPSDMPKKIDWIDGFTTIYINNGKIVVKGEDQKFDLFGNIMQVPTEQLTNDSEVEEEEDSC